MHYDLLKSNLCIWLAFWTNNFEFTQTQSLWCILSHVYCISLIHIYIFIQVETGGSMWFLPLLIVDNVVYPPSQPPTIQPTPSLSSSQSNEYTLDLQVGQSVAINSLNYPRNYPPGSSAREYFLKIPIWMKAVVVVVCECSFQVILCQHQMDTRSAHHVKLIFQKWVVAV